MANTGRALPLVVLAAALALWHAQRVAPVLSTAEAESSPESVVTQHAAFGDEHPRGIPASVLSPQSSVLSPSLELRPLPTESPLRMAYHYPVDATAHESLRANLGRLDVIAPHWLIIDDTGTVRSEARPEAEAFLRTTNRVVLPCVYLKDRDAGHAIVTDPVVGTYALEQLVAEAGRWDGLALDFEGLDPGDRAGLSRFIHRLGAALRNAGKYYAIALPAKTADHRTGWSGAYDYTAIADVADLYLVMAYGYKTSGSATPGSTAPLRWVEASMAYAATQIAPERLILGVPFYGYDWNVSTGPPAHALRHVDTRRLLEQTGAIPTFDPATASAWFRYEADGEQHEVWYEDDRALAAKLALVAKYGLRGAGAWRLGQEDPGAWAVWDQFLTPRGSASSEVARP